MTTVGKSRKSSLLSIAVTAVIVPGLFATIALPAYAFSPAVDTAGLEAVQALQELKTSEAQTVVVGASAGAAEVSRDDFTTTSAAEVARAALATSYSAYNGPSAADFLANPPYPNFSLAQVAQVALQYQGVPYVFGGANPSGFDCSGLIMYVYAQFGIALPHSVAAQAALGTPISRADALPGDIVTMAGHNGIYMGNGTFIDAPYAGKPVL
ncbi:MAG: NlpC/P60 family protein, partial [Rhodoglobus sp.]|nr:NlpC/P60 family protein [Rhodoglobus sp.]